jgi:transposase
VQEQFAEKFPETPVTDSSAVRRLIAKFREIGSVLDADRSDRPSKLNDKKLMDISDSILRITSRSLRNLAQQIARKAIRERLKIFPAASVV